MNEIEKGQLCDATMSAIYYGCSKLDSIPALIRRIIENRAWECRQVKMRGVVQLTNLREMITRKPMEGWGEDPERIEGLIRNDPEVLVMWRDAMKGKEGGNTTCNIITGALATTGTSRSYTVSRLQRESPELFQQVVAKTLSANAAAIQAGWRKKPTVVDQFAALWKKATKDQRDAFLASVCNESPTNSQFMLRQKTNTSTETRPMRPDEKQRQFEVSNGHSVLANESRDTALIQWATGLDKVARIDRKSIYGNPFAMPGDGDRDEVCDAYEKHYIKNKPSILKTLDSLRGKVLICHCVPARCHGLSILEAMGA